MLGLVPTADGRPLGARGIAGLSPEQTLGALSLQDVAAPDNGSIARLSPSDGLAAMGLLDPERPIID
jgi:hypothetical protein